MNYLTSLIIVLSTALVTQTSFAKFQGELLDSSMAFEDAVGLAKKEFFSRNLGSAEISSLLIGRGKYRAYSFGDYRVDMQLYNSSKFNTCIAHIRIETLPLVKLVQPPIILRVEGNEMMVGEVLDLRCE